MLITKLLRGYSRALSCFVQVEFVSKRTRVARQNTRVRVSPGKHTPQIRVYDNKNTKQTQAGKIINTARQQHEINKHILYYCVFMFSVPYVCSMRTSDGNKRCESVREGNWYRVPEKSWCTAGLSSVFTQYMEWNHAYGGPRRSRVLLASRTD